MSSTRKLLSVTEAATILGRNPGVVRQWCADGTLPAVRVGRGWVIAAADLEAVAGIERRRRESTPDK